MVLLWDFFTFQLINTNQQYQVYDIDMAVQKVKVCSCEKANGSRKRWCYCVNCNKFVCVCCPSKDHLIHNHHMAECVIELSLTFDSGYIQNKVHRLFLSAHKTVLHILSLKAWMTLRDQYFLMQRKLVILKQVKLAYLRELELVIFGQPALFNSKHHTLKWFKYLK